MVVDCERETSIYMSPPLPARQRSFDEGSGRSLYAQAVLLISDIESKSTQVHFCLQLHPSCSLGEIITNGHRRS